MRTHRGGRPSGCRRRFQRPRLVAGDRPMPGDVARARRFDLGDRGGEGSVDSGAVARSQLRLDDLPGQLVPESKDLTVTHP
jgi:hypothetical protein